MSLLKRFLLIFIAWALVNPPAFSNPERMDLAEAYALALQKDATIHAAYNQLLSSKEVKPQALADLLPSLNASARTADTRLESESRFSTNGKNTSQFREEGFSVSLRQPLFNWASFERFNQAKKQVSNAEAEYKLAEHNLILRLTEAYLNTLEAEVNVDLANADVKAFTQQLDQAKIRFDVGLIAMTDVHDAQARYDLGIATQIAANNSLHSKQEALIEIIQTNNLQLAPLASELPMTPPTPNNMAAWETLATEHNLSLEIARNNVAIAKKEVNINKAGHYPTIDIVASHDYSETGGGSFGSGFRNESDKLGLELNLPLFVGGKTQSLTRQAAYNHQQSIETLKSQQHSTLRETRDFFRGVNASLLSIKALEQAVLSNQSSLDASKDGLDVGTRSIIDVLDAQSNLSRAKLDLMAAKKDYILNVLRLKSMAGNLSIDDVNDVNQWLEK